MSSDPTLIVKHLPGSSPARFQLCRLSDGKTAPPIEVVTPIGFPVQGRPNSDLVQELHWYLEFFLDYPFPPETDHAERVLAALNAWGEQSFRDLFGSRDAIRLFDVATKDYKRLHLIISSDDPVVLSWPWEALRDPERGTMAHTCQISRQLNQVRDPPPLSDQLPSDRVQILLVTARPAPDEVRYRSISRPLLELIEKHRLPVHVDMLRPPTFAALREHLRHRPGQYQILHFDGHGTYVGPTGTQSGYTLGAVEGRLMFETEEGAPDPISAEQLSSLLAEHALPVVVLSACQSAMLDARAADPFACVAAALLRSGMCAVVAMAYSLFVSGAQRFFPAFYSRLFEEGSVAQAVRAGRQKMLEQPGRVCVRGEYPLQDSIVPVLYQQQAVDLSFARQAKDKFVQRNTRLPEAGFDRNPYGFVGRDAAILELERAMRRKPAGILIYGLGGVGKTTLARGFCQWLDRTDGLDGCLWFSFQEIHSSEYVINRMGEALFGGEFAIVPLQEQLTALEQAFQKRRWLLVWDNFEVVRGIPGTAVTAQLDDEDQKLLTDFLDRIRGGPTKVLITSRSAEEWLGSERRYRLELRGLQGEERWEYCQTILADLGLRVDQKDKDLGELMNLLGGHPLAMRAMLPRLERMTAAQVSHALRQNLAELGASADPEQDRLMATLQFVEQSLSETLRPLLFPLSLHEEYVDRKSLEAMGKLVGDGYSMTQFDTLLRALAAAGLLREVDKVLYEMHPVLTTYLRYRMRDVPLLRREAWIPAFVTEMGRLAILVPQQPMDGQRAFFIAHNRNFHFALREAERLKLDVHTRALLHALASYALSSRDFGTASQLLERLAEFGKQRGDAVEADAYRCLGEIAARQRDWATAQQWYLKSISLLEKQNNSHSVARSSYLQGKIAEMQGDIDVARQWYLKSLAIDAELGNEHGKGFSYHQMGIIAHQQEDLTTAKQYYLRSVTIFEKQGNETDAANTYHQLGIIAQQQDDLSAARQWYLKSLAIKLKEGNDDAAARCYHQLGSIAQEQMDFAAAQRWYLKSLAIKEKYDNKRGAALGYANLGSIAQQQGDFTAAQRWYLKALAIFENQDEGYGQAFLQHQLGVLARLDGRRSEAGGLLVASIKGLAHAGDLEGVDRSAREFLTLFNEAPPDEQQTLQGLWTEAGLPSFLGQSN